jgi:hypothetical protein
MPGALGAGMLHHRSQRVDPLLRLDGIVIVEDAHELLLARMTSDWVLRGRIRF